MNVIVSPGQWKPHRMPPENGGEKSESIEAKAQERSSTPYG